MLTNRDVLEITKIIDNSSSNEELLISLKTYFLENKMFNIKNDPIRIAWQVYQNIIQKKGISL